MEKISPQVLALRKKQECNTKALRIVESLLESKVKTEYFLEALQDINECHYEDVVEERFLLKLCSYPLCGKTLTNVPKKTYQISTINNKVYDITERKKFCSAFCFRASEYIKSQLLTSPLWLRHLESKLELKLLEPDSPPKNS